MKTIQILPVVFFLLVHFTRSYSQVVVMMPDTISTRASLVNDTADYIADLFASEEILQMTLYFDIRKFIKTKNKSEYHPATLVQKINETDSVSRDIKLRARGFMRRSYCSFPPIMLKFKNNENDARQMPGTGKVKLVTHCNRGTANENYVFREYLTYKLFSLVTPYSFKTRLVRITYVDLAKSKKTFTAVGFLIENEHKMAERNKSVIVKSLQITQKNMNAADMARVAVFNYMIGNTDWSVPYQHNIKVIKSLETPGDKGIPVVYDFDYSGLVNTSYSTPALELPIENVTERYYLGRCLRDEELVPVLEEFEGLQPQFIKTINEFEHLPVAERKQVEYYITGFYKQYRSQNYLMSDLNRTCKQF